MTQLPLPDAIPRFKANEERIDIFTNGNTSAAYVSSNGVTVPSLQKFLNDKNSEINIGADSILAQATTARDESVTARNNVAKLVLGAFANDANANTAAASVGGTAEGMQYFNSSSKRMRYYDGTAWRDLSDQAINLVSNNFVGNGSNKNFTLGLAPAQAQNVIVHVNNVLLKPLIDYTVSGTTLTLVAAPANSAPIVTLVIATTATLLVPADNSVTLAKLAAEVIAQLNSVPVGTIIDVYGNGTTTPAGYLKVVPGLEITTAYPELRTWALANGWAVNGSGNPVFPSTDDALFKRQWRAGQTLRDAGRAFGTVQADKMQGHKQGGALSTGSGLASGSAFAFSNDTGSPVTDGVNGTPRTGLETNPANITVTWFIKAYGAILDPATVAAAQVLSDLADARARVVTLENTKGIKHATPVVNPNTAAVSFTSIPAGVKRIMAYSSGLSTSAAASLVLRLRSGGAVQSSGYATNMSAIGAASNVAVADTTGLLVNPSAVVANGAVFAIFERLDPASNIWVYRSNFYYTGNQAIGTGQVTLSGAPDGLQFTTAAGTPLLNGTMNISWEF